MTLIGNVIGRNEHMDMLDRIKELGKDRALSIAEIERELNFGANTLYKWKTSIPRADKVLKLAIFFDVSVDYLLGRETYVDMQVRRKRSYRKLPNKHFSEEKI